MFCCALGAAVLAIALWRKRLLAIFSPGLMCRSALSGLIVIGLALAGSVLVIDLFDHAVAFADSGALLVEDQTTCQAPEE